MGRTSFIEHKGRQIVLLDFSGFTDHQSTLEAIDEAKRFIAQQPKQQQLLTLTNVRGSHFDTDIVKGLRELVEHNKPYVKAGAVVGLSGLRRVVYTTLVHLTGRNLRAFDDMDEAKDYLAAQ
jgi:hypothetical protein